MNTATKPTLETCAGLYKAAVDQAVQAERGIGRILKEAAHYGYSEQQLAEAAGLPVEAHSNR